MSKGLEALKEMRDEAVSDICRYIPRKAHKEVAEWFDERKSIIEKELKGKEKLEKAFDALSKEDEKAKKLLSKEIEKNRALEIIKPLVHLTKDENGCWLWLGLNGRQITQEQYDLLKEVLKDG